MASTVTDLSDPMTQLTINDDTPVGSDRVKVTRAYDADFWMRVTTMVIIGGSMMFLLLTLHPDLILRNNTPTGGDLGAHVWGPAFLRDHLLTNWRLSGWSMDWYAGLPVYRFYMVVPALMILLVNVFLPYGISIKIIAVIGILTLPYATWKFGRLARFVFPIPELLVLASVVFLYDESFTIYGGNIASTMAGEFSFSIALTFAILAFGFFAHGLYTGERRVTTAALIALAALCHGIVLLFVFGGVLLMLAIWADKKRVKWGLSVIGLAVLLASFWVVPFLTSHGFMTDMKYEPRPSGVSDSFWQMYFPLPTAWNIFVMLFAIVGFAASLARRQLVGVWLGVFAIVLAIGVFVTRGNLPIIGLLWNPRVLPFFYLVRYMLMMIGIYEVVVGAVRLASLERLVRASAANVVAATSPKAVPGVSVPGVSVLVENVLVENVLVETIPADTLTAASPAVVVPNSPRTRPMFNVGVVAALALGLTLVLGFHFQELPFGKVVTRSDNSAVYKWGPISTKLSNDGFVDGWTRWNFQGYEGKASYGEYHGVVETMKSLGKDPNNGCGRAVWENNGELNKYGTTMGLMLLPFWTDGCIGSMEGLFFEAAGTTPYHFITAAAMSKQSSNPVRELRYENNNAAKGVQYMQDLGVKYFMGFTPEAIAQASTQSALTEVARSGPWVIYKVATSDIVVPLEVQPVVVHNSGSDPRENWLEVGMSWFQNKQDWAALPAASGPSEWQKIDANIDITRRIGVPGQSSRNVDIVVPATPINVVPLEPVTITNVRIGQSDVRFNVDKVGVPVLVRVSYFPNWNVSGAKGPYRVAPNMMVVIPTSNEVHLSYGRSSLDIFAYLLTLAGLYVAFRIRRRAVTFTD